MSIAIIQRRLAVNKWSIRECESTIGCYKLFKTEADVEGNLEDEYHYHNCLKNYRTALKHLVEEQKFLKKLVKGQK